MPSPTHSAPAGDPVARVDDDTLRVVAGRIAARACDYGLPRVAADRVTLRPFSTASTYPLYIVEIDAGSGAPQRLVVKFPPVFGAHREGLAEFTNLRAMAARLGSSRELRVPRALDYWEDVNALVTEHRPGVRFSTRILSARRFASSRSRDSLARTATLCGKWLRVYHETTSRGDGPAVDDRYRAVVERDLDRKPARGPLAALRRPVREAVDCAASALSGRRVPFAVRHGDFSPDNVHIDGEGICVFDLSHHAPAPVYDDVAFFLVTLDTMNPYPRYWAFDRRVARALASPFLDGYFGTERAARERTDDAIMGAYVLKNLLTRCLRQRGVAAAAGPLALAAFDLLWVAGHYRGLFARAMRRVTALG
jgi:hypothetical protein